MQIRPLTTSDIDLLRDIDATSQRAGYLYVEQSGSGLAMGWRLEERPLRTPTADSGMMTEELLFTARQIAAGHDEGLALAAEYDGTLLASLLARPDPEHGVLRLVDVRVDFDYRRQGMGTALGYLLMQHAREKQCRAVAAETTTDNLVAAKYLAKLGFTLAGIDTRRHSNHDLVKERAALLWYAEVNG